MPRSESTTFPQPIFSEGNITPDPSRFKTKHPSDSQLYKEIGNLLFPEARSSESNEAPWEEVKCPKFRD
jgi:hypothetical protein